MMENKKLLRWPRILIGSIALLFAGVIYAWSILKAPLAMEFGWSPAALGLNYSLTISMFCLGGMFSGLLAKKLSAKLRTIIGAIMVFIGFFITSRLSGESLLPLYLAYGGLSGFGIGLVYNAITAATAAWYPDKKGLCSGILFMAFGFSTLILGNIAGKMIDLPEIGWRNTFLLYGIIISLVLFIAAFFLKMPSKELELPKAQIKNKTKQNFETLDCTGFAMIKRATFIKMFIFFFLLAAVGSTAISFAKDVSVAVGATASFAVTIVGFLSIFNGLGRVISGLIYDTMGMRIAQIVMSGIVIMASCSTLAAVMLNNIPLVVIGLSLCGFSYGFSPTMSAAMIASFYGTKNFALNLSLINLVLFPASFTAAFSGVLLTQFGSFSSVFMMLTVFSLLGLFINMSIKRP